MAINIIFPVKGQSKGTSFLLTTGQKVAINFTDDEDVYDSDSPYASQVTTYWIQIGSMCRRASKEEIEAIIDQLEKDIAANAQVAEADRIREALDTHTRKWVEKSVRVKRPGHTPVPVYDMKVRLVPA